MDSGNVANNPLLCWEITQRQRDGLVKISEKIKTQGEKSGEWRNLGRGMENPMPINWCHKTKQNKNNQNNEAIPYSSSVQKSSAARGGEPFCCQGPLDIYDIICEPHRNDQIKDEPTLNVWHFEFYLGLPWQGGPK